MRAQRHTAPFLLRKCASAKRRKSQQEFTCQTIKDGKDLEEVRKKIRENTWSVDNRDGLLAAKQEDYLQCLEINHIKLEQDESKRRENLMNKRTESDKVSQQL